MNDIEIRKVQRALERAADGIEPLPEHDVARMARAATSAERHVRVRTARRRWRTAGPAALAGAAIASLLVVPLLHRSSSRPASGTSAVHSGEIVSFPAGSALERLLSNTRRNS